MTPAAGLTLAYWLHLLATVVWIGGLASLSLFVLPAARRSLTAQQYAGFLGALKVRLQQVGWFSLMILIFTGLFQMISHPNYEGLLAIGAPWAVAILVKHLAVGVMIVLSAYVTWGLTPALQRLALLQSHGKEIPAAEAEKLQRREALLLNLNLIISIIILALTALARTSS